MTELTLNDSQRSAVAHRDGPMMVLAGPGSGKTTVITYRTLYLIRRHRIPPSAILIVTYSKAASEQMRARFESLSDERGVLFGTFHAVFYRILRARFGYTTAQIVKEEERRHLVKHMLAEMQYALEEDFLSAVLSELSLVKNELFDLRYYHSAVIGTEDFVHLFERYEQYKTDNGKLDFDDMLTRCYQLLSEEPDILSLWRQRFQYIMIDEFQDINRVQYECAKLLTEPARNLFIVGDDDQSIYRFRGARPEFLLHFPKDFPDAKQVVLDVNYRSADAIIHFSNQLIAPNNLRFGKRIVGTGKAGAEPIYLTTDDSNGEAVLIAKHIKTIQKNKGDLNSVAVIYRVNLQSRALADAFLQANLPYQVKDEISVLYEHWIAKDIFAYLRLSRRPPKGHNPDEERIVNKPYRFIGKAFLLSAKKAGLSIFEAYSRDPSMHDAQRLRIEELYADLQSIGKRTPYEAVLHIRRIVEYNRHIKEYATYRKLDPTGLYEILDELQDAAKPFSTIDAFLAHGEDVIQAAKENKDDDTPRVTLSTMHSAKGLEFDTVFIAGAVEGVVPHVRSKTEAELEEERRLLYVGVTRARDILYISIPRSRYDKPVKCSRFLEASVSGNKKQQEQQKQQKQQKQNGSESKSESKSKSKSN